MRAVALLWCTLAVGMAALLSGITINGAGAINSTRVEDYLVPLNTTRVVRVGYIATRSFFQRPFVGGFIYDLVFRATQSYWLEKGDNVEFEVIYGEAAPTEDIPDSIRCRQVAENLIKANVDVVIGPSSSECAIPAAAVLGTVGIPQISQSTTSQALSNKTLYPTFFRITPSDAYQAALIARLVGLCSWTKIGVIATTDAWGLGLANSLDEELKSYNSSIAHRLLLPQGLSRENITALVKEYRKTVETSVHVVIALREDGINCLSAIITAGMVGPGWNWIVTNGLTVNPGVTADLLQPFAGMLGIVPLTPGGPLYDEFHNFKDQYGYHDFINDTSIPTASPWHFDSAAIVHYAVNSAPTWTNSSIENRRILLKRLREYSSLKTGVPGASSEAIFFDEHQDGPDLYQILNVVNGKFVRVADSDMGLIIPTEMNVQWSSPEYIGFTQCPSQDPPASESQNDNTSTILIAVIVSLAALVVAATIFVVVLVRRHRIKMTPHDFAEDLKETGLATNILLPPQELPRSSIILGELLGAGYYGRVYKATLDESDSSGLPTRPVAVKMCHEHATSVDIRALLKEAAYMAQFQGHANVVTLIGVVTRGQPVCLVMEYCEHGSLDSYLRTTFQRLQLSVSSKIRMGMDILEGMCFISSKGAIHRDLACRNILVTLNFTCKITDFGLTRNQIYYSSNADTLPVKWSAPEAITDGQFSMASDVWSFGIVMCEIFLNGSHPYPNMSNEAVRLGLVCGDLRHPQVPTMPDKLYEILCACWAEDPSQRPSFPTLRQQFIELLSCSDEYMSCKLDAMIKESQQKLNTCLNGCILLDGESARVVITPELMTIGGKQEIV
eukprot:m.126863 g.126863  ORF g.126863 m.126863 type:complete len:842 (-) comp15645_c1_seq3:1805-4330(-)